MGARARKLALASLCVGLGAWGLRLDAQSTPEPRLATPGFHHLHLNSVNPDAAIDFYTKYFPSTARTTFDGKPALKSPNNVLVLFNKVNAPQATQPPTALWHFGWHVTDVHKSQEMFAKLGAQFLPLYTGEKNNTVFISSDTWPGTGGVLGLTALGASVVELDATAAGYGW